MLLRFFACAALLCTLNVAATAQKQKRPKPALNVKEAQRVVAATRGFGLKTGAVKVKGVSPAGSTPVVVTAEVKEAFRLVRIEDERVPQTGGAFKQKRWRAVEFRTGDRAWEEFDLFAAAAGEQRVEAARLALEEIVTEFESRQAELKGKGEAKAAEPLTSGPLTVKQLSAMGSSAVAEVVVEAAFTLSKDERGRWQVSEVTLGGETVSDLESLWRAVNARKAERARADLAALAGALEAFRRERGSYVVARDSVVLQDYLAPRYAKQIIRLDPWHNPYRYEGTPARYTLGSDGPDGKPGTADDVTLSR